MKNINKNFVSYSGEDQMKKKRESACQKQGYFNLLQSANRLPGACTHPTGGTLSPMEFWFLQVTLSAELGTSSRLELPAGNLDVICLPSFWPLYRILQV